MPFVWGGAEAAGSSGGANRVLRIEPDHVEEALAVFRRALDELEPTIAKARRGFRMIPPGADPVSVDAAAAISGRGLDGPNPVLRAWEGAVAQIRSIVDQLELARARSVTVGAPAHHDREA
ncbi:hypothetical protein LX15_005828 [Streptoalloteichus tenebrarius]|uniref:PE domain-containing protein n=1 Tax=Streptoalloteichus tenebrarius (strain ATCC 17920 / DSM 40477 / JCM 4838 / CBS 697.72 / NBRC 16177 / NCIMB 11028 / NRRL B-12390 / A12253. 1 / ISP 5477) TaxID=1933 RepID=A0ABT1I2U2_STRSD|nr:hypothetical protein [Streptoalloteichus tenebrarius]MCP2262096.1 hypothetical protein [Streptoalloteichus tenebrarius]BFF02250.1 hypothetical protein GCM10020241_39250 [Streptoalloteichus tenebrarius]